MGSDQFEIGEIIYSREKATDLKLDTPVYRFMSFDALQEILLSQTIALIKTKYWEDTYENFLFKAEVTADETPFDLASFQQWIFGSCWTKKCETDALWRIYSQDKCGVRIRSTIGKLAHSLQNEFDKSRTWFANIGEVSYHSIEDIVAHFEAFSGGEFVTRATDLFRDSMFMKRQEFDHEKEIRIILNVKRKACVSSEVVPLPIDPKDVIEEITFDPRISDDLRELFVSKLSLIGYEKIANKSSLYSQDKLKIRFKSSDDRFDVAGAGNDHPAKP